MYMSRMSFETSYQQKVGRASSWDIHPPIKRIESGTTNCGVLRKAATSCGANQWFGIEGERLNVDQIVPTTQPAPTIAPSTTYFPATIQPIGTPVPQPAVPLNNFDNVYSQEDIVNSSFPITGSLEAQDPVKPDSNSLDEPEEEISDQHIEHLDDGLRDALAITETNEALLEW